MERLPVLPVLPQLPASEAFDRSDPRPVGGDREREAAIRPPALQEHSASAALAVVTALLGAGQAELLAQDVQQRGARVDRYAALLAVDAQRDLRELGRLWRGFIAQGMTTSLRYGLWACACQAVGA